MKRLYDEDDVRELFQELRAETTAQGRAPDFGTMIERAKSEVGRRPSLEVVPGAPREDGGPAKGSRRFVWAGGWVSAGIAAAVAGLLFTGIGTDQDAEFERMVAGFANDASGGAWRSPTAGLLEVPGLDLLRGVPDIGGSARGGVGEPPESSTSDEREGRL